MTQENISLKPYQAGTPNHSCWVVTDGKIGMENQCVGLAEALQLTPIIKRIKLRQPWHALSPWLRLGLGHAFKPHADRITPPWPDILIASGRCSIPASLYVKQQHPRCFTVQIQNPVMRASAFDLVIVPEHDQLQGANVVTSKGALHRVNEALIAKEAHDIAARYAHLPRPYIVALIGGENAAYSFDGAEIIKLAMALADAAKNLGGSLLVTTSRRTGAEATALLERAFKGSDVPHALWRGEADGSNPYLGLLGLADAIIATSDSVNMATEALASGKAVYVWDLPSKNTSSSGKFSRFHADLRQNGYCQRLNDWPEAQSLSLSPPPKLNEMQRIAKIIAEKLI